MLSLNERSLTNEWNKCRDTVCSVVSRNETAGCKEEVWASIQGRLNWARSRLGEPARGDGMQFSGDKCVVKMN